MPGDFPTDRYNAVFDRTLSQVAAAAVVHEQFAGAWNALAYRFHAMADEERTVSSLFLTKASPKPAIRYQQERSLFGFFSNGFSVFESAFYALFALGALLSPSHFPIATAKDQQRISPQTSSAAFAKAFPGDPINAVLSGLLSNAQFIEWREIRNILTHRAAPGRTFFVSFTDATDAPLPDEWKIKGISLDNQMAAVRRNELSSQLDRLLEGIEDFTLRRF